MQVIRIIYDLLHMLGFLPITSGAQNNRIWDRVSFLFESFAWDTFVIVYTFASALAPLEQNTLYVKGTYVMTIISEGNEDKPKQSRK